MEVITMPDSLFAELDKMRRNPVDFSVISMGNCRFCGGGTKRAYQLSGAKSEFIAGSWCSEHGWLHFDSVTYPPTERLTASEVEDRRLERQRKAKAAARPKKVWCGHCDGWADHTTQNCMLPVYN